MAYYQGKRLKGAGLAIPATWSFKPFKGLKGLKGRVAGMASPGPLSTCTPFVPFGTHDTQVTVAITCFQRHDVHISDIPK